MFGLKRSTHYRLVSLKHEQWRDLIRDVVVVRCWYIYIYQKKKKNNKHIIFIRLFYKWSLFLLLIKKDFPFNEEGLSWSWSYGSWIYNYLYNQCLSLLKLCSWGGVLDTALFVSDLFRSVVFSGYSGFLYNKNDLHDITEILLKVASLNTMTSV